MGYTTSGIRNIALVGQAGAGKTSLEEEYWGDGETLPPPAKPTPPAGS